MSRYSMVPEPIFNGPPWIVPRAVYVHVPFCAHRCGYCDFAIAVDRESEMAAYLDALEMEAGRLGGPFPVDTWYVGGGTPSLLPEPLLARLGGLLARWFPLAGGGEATLEANPESFGPQKARLLRGIGFNRVSIGIQSFSQGSLDALTRPHRADASAEAVEVARNAGLAVSADLIFGVPGQDLSGWEADIRRVASLGPSHVSAYGLTYEKGTPLERLARSGKVLPLSDDLEGAMYSLAMDLLPELGFCQYEISNYSRPGSESRHNAVYWANHAYFGIGMGAARYVGGERATNTRDLSDYIRKALAGEPLSRPGERLEGLEAARETLYLNLRRTRGADPLEFPDRTGVDLSRMVNGLGRVIDAGLLEVAPDGCLRLTRRGRLLADTVAGEVLARSGGPA
ncbi:MAG: radical SAM family heme chaperone HemW [Planctomycetes bacterium]|nr:radical SAM family heme chaperone HemW [Planctomycetota bacterium]